MRRPTGTVVSLLLLCASLVATAPHESTRFDHDLSTNPGHQHPQRPWRKLSDAVIRRIWGIPQKQKSSGAASDGLGPLAGTPGREMVARYGDDVVLRFTVRTAEEAQALADASRILFLDVWEFNADWVDIRLAKDVLPSLLGLLPSSLHTAHVPLMQDLGLVQAIFDSYPSPSATQSHEGVRSYSPNLGPPSHAVRGHPFFKEYQPMSVINPWMSLMASMFTTHVRRISVGVTYEGRDIPALRVGVHPTNNDQPSPSRKTILVVGGSHAREWISTSTVNYVAWSFINAYGKDREITRLLEHFDFVFVPTLNPDGYVYSWETDRLWRKNRQPTSLRFCHGVDLDRSYPYQWDGESKPTNPCSESFAGESPFDGVESLRFAAWAKNETENNNVELVGFMDLHSYSQQILYPFAYSCRDDPPTLEDLEEVALGLAKAIRISRKGHAYKVTSACEGNVAISEDKKDKIILPRIESSGGSPLDWFYHEMKIKHAYQIKLRDTGSYGFLLPKENIIPTGEEILDAVLYLGRFMLGEIGFTNDAPNAPEQMSKESLQKKLDGDHQTEEVEEL